MSGKTVLDEVFLEFDLRNVRPYSVRRSIAALALCANITEHIISHLFLILFATQGVQDRHRASTSIAALIHTDLRAVIVLMALGYDVQARNLLRGLRERIDVFSCCALSNEFSKKFISAQTFEHVNKFWHDSVSKGKARKFLSKRFSELTGAEDGMLDQYWGEWREEADSMLSASEHTFHIAGLIATFPQLRKPESEFGLDGLPSTVSLWTVRTTLHFLWEMLMNCRVAFNELRDGTLEVSGKPDNELNWNVKKEYPRHFNFLMQTLDAYYGNDWLNSQDG